MNTNSTFMPTRKARGHMSFGHHITSNSHEHVISTRMSVEQEASRGSAPPMPPVILQAIHARRQMASRDNTTPSRPSGNDHKEEAAQGQQEGRGLNYPSAQPSASTTAQRNQTSNSSQAMHLGSQDQEQAEGVAPQATAAFKRY